MERRRYPWPKMAVLCVLLIALTACLKNPDPALQLTPYQEARVVYVAVAKAYLAYYDTQSAEKQDELFEKVGKLILDADNTLKEWKEAEAEGQPVLENVELWATLLEKITDALKRYGVKIGD